MNTRGRFILGGVLVFGTAVYLMVSSISETGMFWLTPTELQAKVAEDPSYRAVSVQVGAKVLPGSIVRSPAGKSVAFVATDGGTQFKVVYNNIPPDTFMDDAEVLITGKLLNDGSFEATVLLTKCASRFEAELDSADLKYRQTPGYKAAGKATQ